MVRAVRVSPEVFLSAASAVLFLPTCFQQRGFVGVGIEGVHCQIGFCAANVAEVRPAGFLLPAVSEFAKVAC